MRRSPSKGFTTNKYVPVCAGACNAPCFPVMCLEESRNPITFHHSTSASPGVVTVTYSFAPTTVG